LAARLKPGPSRCFSPAKFKNRSQKQRAGAPAPHSDGEDRAARLRAGSPGPVLFFSPIPGLSPLRQAQGRLWAVVFRRFAAGFWVLRGKRKRPHSFLIVALINAGNYLLSHTLSRAIQSARRDWRRSGVCLPIKKDEAGPETDTYENKPFQNVVTPMINPQRHSANGSEQARDPTK
jgi:hypothetical protein